MYRTKLNNSGIKLKNVNFSCHFELFKIYIENDEHLFETLRFQKPKLKCESMKLQSSSLRLFVVFEYQLVLNIQLDGTSM